MAARKKIRYKIASKQKGETVEGYPAGRCMGVRKSKSRWGTQWRVDHCLNGYSLAQGLRTKKDAVTVAKSLSDALPAKFCSPSAKETLAALRSKSGKASGVTEYMQYVNQWNNRSDNKSPLLSIAAWKKHEGR